MRSGGLAVQDEGEMKKTFCDKCQVLLEDKTDITSFLATLGWERAPDWRKEADLCRNCQKVILDLLNEFFGASRPDQGDRR